MQSLLIIGAGSAGLAAGCYAQMNGYRTTILEMATTPGGLCTSWERGGYLFDGSVAGLAGCAPGSPLYRLWQEIGVAAYCPLFHGENFGHIHGLDGKAVSVYTNIDRLQSHLLDLYPAEERPVLEFTKALRGVLDIDIPFSDAAGLKAVQQGIRNAVSSIAHLPVLLKYGKMTVLDFASTIQDPYLAQAFSNLVHFGGPDVPLLTVLLPLAYAHKGMSGIPLRGWLSFARAIERRFLELGGKVRYNAKAAGLIVENAAVRGVALEDGTKLYADRVLSAADGRFSHSMLLGKSEKEIRELFVPDQLSDQPVQVNIGVDMDLSADDGPVTYILAEPFRAAGREHGKITVHNKYYDDKAAPKGKSAVTAFMDSGYDWWKNIAADTGRYEEEKGRCADMVIQTVEQYHPGFRDRTEVVEVSTPLTRERLTGNWRGAMQARKPDRSMIKALMQSAPRYADKGIEGLYMAGQWVEAWGGITTAVLSGRKAVQAMCKNDGKRFTASRV